MISRVGWWAAIAWGIVLTALVCRHFFTLEPGEYFQNHESYGYGVRLMEFRDCLSHGYIFPEWCSHFRGGYGAPYFHYYQPGFFYAASLTSPEWPMAWQVGLPTCGFVFVGYLGMLFLMGTRLGTLPGSLAGTLLLVCPYLHTNLYLRGDLSEAAAMMLVPSVLHILVRQLERPTIMGTWIGIILAALIPVTHPAVGLVSYGFFAVLAIAVAVTTRQVGSLFRAVLLLSIGVGLSAFYWFPVFYDSSLVMAEEAWIGQVEGGHYHYARHFVPLRDFFNTNTTVTPIPVKLGLIQTLLASTGVIILYTKRHDWSMGQRTVGAVCVGIFFGSLFLITPQSSAIWDYLPLLERIQFPWRLLTLVSIGMAGMACLSVAGIRSTHVQAGLTLGLIAVITGLAVNRSNLRHESVPDIPIAASIADLFFAPDLANEWLPRGAKILRTPKTHRKPYSQESSAEIESYRILTGAITCHVKTDSAAMVVLPHYYFPLGWSAHFNGRTISLSHQQDGLMQVRLPAQADGILHIQWHTTRTKWIGVGISLASCLLGIIGVVWIHHREREEPLSDLGTGSGR